MAPSSLNSFALYSTTPEEILTIAHSLKTTHSSGPDELNPSIITPIVDCIACPIAEIINCSLNTGIVPAALKTAKVIPIYKQGPNDNIANYRPISLLNYFSKILEKIMYVRLYDYIDKKISFAPTSMAFSQATLL